MCVHVHPVQCAMTDPVTMGRTVTCVTWSSLHKEVCVVGYGPDPSSPTAPLGILALWSVLTPQVPACALCV